MEPRDEMILFTPAALLGLLAQIDELSDVDVGLVEGLDGNLQLTVGDSTYNIMPENITDVEVDPEVVDKVEDANASEYNELYESTDLDAVPDDQIEGGVLKELLKDLALGGIIRLGKKLLK